MVLPQVLNSWPVESPRVHHNSLTWSNPSRPSLCETSCQPLEPSLCAEPNSTSCLHISSCSAMEHQAVVVKMFFSPSSYCVIIASSHLLMFFIFLLCSILKLQIQGDCVFEGRVFQYMVVFIVSQHWKISPRVHNHTGRQCLMLTCEHDEAGE